MGPSEIDCFVQRNAAAPHLDCTKGQYRASKNDRTVLTAAPHALKEKAMSSTPTKHTLADQSAWIQRKHFRAGSISAALVCLALIAMTFSTPPQLSPTALHSTAIGVMALLALFLVVRSWRQQARDRSALAQSRAALWEAQQLAETGSLTYRFNDQTWDSSPMFNTIAGITGAGDRDAARLFGLLDRRDRVHLRRLIGAAYIDGGTFDRAVLQIWRPDGEQRWLHARGKVMTESDGAPILLFTVQDITRRKSAEEEISRLSCYDQLTELPNRRMLMGRLAAMLQADASPSALFLVGIDQIKVLNEMQGRDRGNLLLRAVAARVKSCVGANHMVARVGGDQFMVLACDMPGDAAVAHIAAAHLAEQLRTVAGGCFDLAGLRYQCSVSVGVTVVERSVAGIDSLMKRADVSLSQAKAAGRNIVHFYNPAMQAAETARVALEGDLRLAVAAGQFELHYQAQVDSLGRILGAEALVRWRHPVRGAVSPAKFIPLCEATGLILPLGRWVLEAACEQLADWSREPRLARLTLSVNVSACQFNEPGFVEQVNAALRHSGVNPSRLKLELTEGSLLENTEHVVATIGALKAAGVGISLDDFGTGYSSLAYLKRLPLDQLKIDQAFVRDLSTDASDLAIVRTIIALGHSFGIEVIAEGVETEAQRTLLISLGCRVFQGFLFARPLPIAQFEASVAKVFDLP